jgi:hypothetical protein
MLAVRRPHPRRLPPVLPAVNPLTGSPPHSPEPNKVLVGAHVVIEVCISHGPAAQVHELPRVVLLAAYPSGLNPHWTASGLAEAFRKLGEAAG